MKLFKLCILIILGFLSFLGGQYSSDRNALKHRILDTEEQIVVTELLLKEHLSNCNKAGYRRFVTFHEHNIDKAYRLSKYVIGFPYFLGEGFAEEVSDTFDPYRVGFVQFKSEFKSSCGSV